MKTVIKSCIIALIILLSSIILNGTYWVLSDIQMDCYNKVYNEKQDLNFYEKCSIYSLHVGICCVGWVLSPEATINEILCTFPTSDIIEIHSNSFSKSKTVSTFIHKYPNSFKNNPTWLYWNPNLSSYGYVTPYILNLESIQDLRCALTANGSCLYKEDEVWKITYRNNEFKYPLIKGYTCIGPFKFHEALFRYLQEIGWMYIPKIIWIL